MSQENTKNREQQPIKKIISRMTKGSSGVVEQKKQSSLSEKIERIQ